MSISDIATRKLGTGMASALDAIEIINALNAANPAGASLTAFTDTITTTNSGTQSNSTVLTSRVNRISTVNTAGDGIELPLLSSAGTIVIIVNDTTNYISVYGSGTDTINDVATATGIKQPGDSIVAYIGATPAPAGKWYTLGLGLGYADGTNGAVTFPGSQTLGVAPATNSAGTVITNAAALPAGGYSIYPVTSTNTGGVQIQSADCVTGRTFTVVSTVINTNLRVFPPTNGTIGNQSANSVINAAASSVAARAMTFTCINGAAATFSVELGAVA